MVLIAPSILAADFTRLGEEIATVERAGADWIHLDVMDGRFVPNISYGPAVCAAARRACRLHLDCHLMIEEPERSLEAFAQAGCDSITVHVEACAHLHRTLERIRALGKQVGVALNPATPLNVLDHVGDMVDRVLLMSVNPGFGGQRLIPAVLDKVRRLRPLARERGLLVEVDGGINRETAPAALKAGADVLVAGSAVFGAADYAAAISELRGEVEV